MDLSSCSCDKAGFCPVFHRDMDEKNHQWCKTTTIQKREKYHSSTTDISLFSEQLPKKNSDLAICTIPANKYSMDLLNITRDSIKEYAKKCGADYIELSGDKSPDWPMANKYRVYEVAYQYKKTLYLDCDIAVNEFSPNIFLETPDDKISAYNEWKIWELQNKTDWIINEQRQIINELAVNSKTKNYMINGGVLVIPNSVCEFYKEPKGKYPKFWCFDQNYLTLTLPEEKFYNLEDKWNLLLEKNKDFWLKTRSSFFIHCNGGKSKTEERKRILSGFSKQFEQKSKHRVSLVLNTLQSGGAETWHRQLAKHIDPYRIATVNKSHARWKKEFKKYNFCDNKTGAVDAVKNSEVSIVWMLGGKHTKPEYQQIFEEIGYSKKLITVIHNTDEWEFVNASRTPSKKVVCVGEQPRLEYLEYLKNNNIPFNEKDIVCIPNGPDSEHVKPNISKSEARKKLSIEENEILLMTCARINPQKNIESIVETMKLLPSNYRCVIVGYQKRNEFPKTAKYKDLGKLQYDFNNVSSNLSAYQCYESLYNAEIFKSIAFSKGRIQILPFQDQINDLLIAADVYLQPSRFEGYGLSAVEAMTLKIPVVGTDAGILKEFPIFKIPTHKYKWDQRINATCIEIRPSDFKDAILRVLENKNITNAKINSCYNKAIRLEKEFYSKWNDIIDEVAQNE